MAEQRHLYQAIYPRNSKCRKLSRHHHPKSRTGDRSNTNYPNVTLHGNRHHKLNNSLEVLVTMHNNSLSHNSPTSNANLLPAARTGMYKLLNRRRSSPLNLSMIW
jgi:hypothetical protein